MGTVTVAGTDFYVPQTPLIKTPEMLQVFTAELPDLRIRGAPSTLKFPGEFRTLIIRQP